MVEARHILGDRMTSTGCSSSRHTLPPQAPPLATVRRATRRHTATGRPSGRPRDVPVTPEAGTYYGEVLTGGWESQLQGTSHDQSPMTGAGWGFWPRTHDQSQMTGGSRDAGASHGGSQDHSPTHSHGDYDSAFHGGSQDQSPPLQSHLGYAGASHGGSSQYETPVRGFDEYATRTNPWTSSTSTTVEEDIDAVPQRQQPHRRVKGRGRRCFTGSHIL